MTANWRIALLAAWSAGCFGPVGPVDCSGPPAGDMSVSCFDVERQGSVYTYTPVPVGTTRECEGMPGQTRACVSDGQGGAVWTLCAAGEDLSVQDLMAPAAGDGGGGD